MAILSPRLTATPNLPVTYNVGMAETFSWIPIEGAGRPLFARANYITNFEDFTVSISAAELNINSIEIKDGNSNRVADVEDAGNGLNALRVLTQDLDPFTDTVSLADKNGNNVSVTPSTSSLNVNITNWSTDLSATILNPVTISNPVTSISVNNLLSSLNVTVLNSITAFTVLNPVTAVNVLNPLSAFTVLNPVTAVTILNPITSFDVCGEFSITNTVSSLVLNPLTSINVYGDVNVTNPLTATVQQQAPLFVTYADNFQTDAFGRLRTSQPSTLFDSKQLYGKAPQFYDEVISGTSSITFSAYDSCTILKTSSENDYAINQTRVRFNYSPGKSICYMFTGLFTPEPNVIKRIGCFQSLSAAPYEPSDGMFLEVTQNGPVFRSVKTQGSLYTQYIPQSAWNVDKMDGTGPSGYTLNLSAVNLFIIDYEWLGVGRVRFGFYQNGRPYYCHQDDHVDDNLQGPYITYPNQPVRYEIRQTGSGSGTLKQICATVLSEGGEDDVGSLVTASVSGTGVTVTSTTDQWTPVLGIRCTPGYFNLVNTVKSLEILNNTSRSIIYQLVFNPTITPVLNWQTIDYGLIQQAIGGTTYTLTNLGYPLITNYATPNNRAGFSQTDISKALARLGTSINGIPDTLWIIARFLDNTGASADIYASMNLLLRG